MRECSIKLWYPPLLTLCEKAVTNWLALHQLQIPKSSPAYAERQPRNKWKEMRETPDVLLLLAVLPSYRRSPLANFRTKEVGKRTRERHIHVLSVVENSVRKTMLKSTWQHVSKGTGTPMVPVGMMLGGTCRVEQRPWIHNRSKKCSCWFILTKS